MRPGLAAAFFIVFALAACADTPGRWSAYVYPDASDLSTWNRTDRFRTRAMCERAAKESVAKLPEPKKASYRCIILQPI